MPSQARQYWNQRAVSVALRSVRGMALAAQRGIVAAVLVSIPIMALWLPSHM